jgi:hypothetical protein
MDDGAFEELIFRFGFLTEPSVSAIFQDRFDPASWGRAKLRRWAARYARVAQDHGATAAANFLLLCLLQAMPVRDKAKEHEVRNVMPWLRRYHA